MDGELKMSMLLIVAIIIVYAESYTPDFGQQFTALMSNDLGVTNYTYYFDFIEQKERVDYPGPNNVSVTIMDHAANLAYTFYLVNNQVEECYIYKQYIPLEKFMFPSGLLWFGHTTVNGIYCDEYIQPGLPPVDKFYITTDTPPKPVRAYYPAGFDAPEFQVDYYNFEYSVDPDVFTPPQPCTQDQKQKFL